MLATIRRWFRRSPPAAPSVIVVDTISAPLPEPPTVSTADAAPATAAYPDGDLGDHLRAQLVERIEALRAALPAADRDGDTGALLSMLLRSGDAGIRQLPAAAQDALRLCNDPLASLQQLVPLFMKDPTLTQALLRQANAAWYGAAAPVVGLGDAMQRVGTGGVRSVLLAATVQGLLCRPGGVFAEMADRTWAHTCRTAPLARALASAFEAHPDEAFALGLLHDVGKLVIFDAATALRTERRRELKLHRATVRAVLAQAHEPLGGLAVRLWGLGDPAALAVATHHRRPAPAYRDPLCETLHVAEKADLAMIHGAVLDLEALWAAGLLTGSAERVSSVLAGTH